MSFLFDGSVPAAVARALADAGEAVTHVSFENLRGATDRSLIATVKSRDWCLVTANEAPLTRAERRAWMDLGIGLFVLVGDPRRTGFEWLTLIIRRWPDIRKLAARRRPPFVIAIPDGRSKTVKKRRRRRSS